MQNEIFLQEGFDRGIISKRKKRFLFSPGHLLSGEGKDKGFIFLFVSCFLWGMERAHVTDYVIGVDHKNFS